ncbi:hypothetical protein E05_46580 [Plautia stali symbiont]|nr:hypothetical protein E05_46580 [Plautia stali symbiont]
MNRTQNAGFTLPELLLVMVIAGILSIAALQGWQQYQQLRESVLQLQSFLLRLRAHASWHNRDLSLCAATGRKRLPRHRAAARRRVSAAVALAVSAAL